MQYHVVHLKEHFPQLGENRKDPVLTAYLPDTLWEMGWQNKKYPAILVCPGGGYGFVSAREGEPIAMKLLAMGYCVYVLNYSVAPNHFPTQLCEVAAAMELIHANADAWHTDADRIAIMGFSAGGHLAGHYSNCYNIPEVRAVFPESKPVKASILCYPVITADPSFYHGGSICNLSGCDTITQEIIAKFSLEKHVTEATPPAFIWHTSEDETVPVKNSLIYADALAKYHIPFALHIYPHGNHGLSTVDDATCHSLSDQITPVSQWLTTLKDWLRITL